MSAQTFMEAFALVEAHYRAEVYKATWEHLAPRKNKTYRGYAIFAFGCFGSECLNPTVLECELGLDSSPWFHDALIEFLETFGGDAATGHVYRWDGTFRNYKFKGTVKRISLTPSHSPGAGTGQSGDGGAKSGGGE